MADREDYFTITLAKYEEPLWGFIHYGPARWGFGLWRWTLIVELWWLR